MKELNLGRILIENRRKRGITQEELAAPYRRFKRSRFKMGNRLFSARYFSVAAAGVLL